MPARSADPNLLVATETADDAGVYRLNERLALVQTVDFFPPLVDDPYVFGQIAAANSLSDIYAMNGRPLTALNIVGFPDDVLPLTMSRKSGVFRRMRTLAQLRATLACPVKRTW